MQSLFSRGKATSPFFLLLIFAVSFFVYVRSLDNDLIFDDRALTVENSIVTSPSWETVSSSYRPLRTASYAIDHALFGSAPAGFRVMNIGYHLIVILLVFFFVRSLSGGTLAAIIAAAFFALHPVQTDAVAYISGRRDILVALFFMASLVVFLRYIRSGGPGYLALSLFAFILSFLSKETGTVAPLVMLAMLFLFGRAVPPARKKLLLAIFLLLLSGAVVLALRGGGSPLIYGGNIVFHGNSAATHYLTAATLLPYYLKQTLFPLQLIMDNANYPLLTVAGMKLICSLLTILPYLAIALFLYRKKYISLSFYMFFFLVTLLPVLQIVPLHEIAADHYLYLPLVGFCGITGELGALAWHWMRQNRRIVMSAVFLTVLCVTLPLYSLKTTTRIGEMSDIYTVLLADHKWRPISFRGLYTLGAFYMDVGEPDIAYRYYRAALDTGYYDASLYGNLIGYHIVKGDHAEALRYFEERERGGEAVSPSTFAHTALIYAIRGDCGRALSTIQRILPQTFERHGAIVVQCNDLHKKDLFGRIDHLRAAGFLIEARPLYERFLESPGSEPAEKELRMREFAGILERYDLPSADLLLREVAGEERSEWAIHQKREIREAKERVRRICAWMDGILRNGFCFNNY